MNAKEWAQLKEVFSAALDLEPAQRAAFLDQRCFGDNAFRAKAEALLTQQALSGGIFDDLEARRRTVVRYFESTNRTLEEGAVVSGRWVIDFLIGRGGMGEVYKAHDRQLGRAVAVKIMRPAAVRPDLLIRFQQEREILAVLDHPNVARLLDAGSTGDGRPFLVMEYVAGQPLDRYCDEAKLDWRARLKLFQRVCDVVQYAHRNLVVHRDLKPSNILVTEDGEVKLLDFGIAKLLQPFAGASTADFTQTAMLILTPDYASPEQIDNAPVTTATDVYALGVTLYLLLTGQKPFSFSDRAPHEISRMICEQEPARPSSIPGLAEKGKRLAGDLDTILLRALRKDPAERFASVEQFSEDVQLYLEGRPIRSRPRNFVYRAKKFLLRNKFSSVAALTTIVLLMAALAVVFREVQVARNERDRADRRFQEVHALSTWLLFDLHDAIASLPAATVLRGLLVERALRYLDRLEKDAGHDVTIEREVAAAYERIGFVQGHPYWGNIGDTGAALKSYQKALAIRQSLSPPSGADRQSITELAATYQDLGEVEAVRGDLSGATKSFRAGLALLDPLWIAVRKTVLPALLSLTRTPI